MLIRLSYPLDCKEWIELKWDALVSDKKKAAFRQPFV